MVSTRITRQFHYGPTCYRLICSPSTVSRIYPWYVRARTRTLTLSITISQIPYPSSPCHFSLFPLNPTLNILPVSVAESSDEFHVCGCGTEDFNGFYVAKGEHGGVPQYVHDDDRFDPNSSMPLPTLSRTTLIVGVSLIDQARDKI